MDQGTDITTGLMKAVHFLSQQRHRNLRQKFEYQEAGSVVHASRCISKSDRERVDVLLKQVGKLDAANPENHSQIENLISELSKLPVKFIPVKREIRIDRSKRYPYRSTRQVAQVQL